MCKPKSWTRLLAKETQSKNVSILATRSDGEIFNKGIIITRRETTFETTEKIIAAINSLETYRSCECTSSRTCNKHLEFKEKENDPNAKSNFSKKS